MVSLKMSRAGSFNSLFQSKSHPFFFVRNFRSAYVTMEISVLKLSPVITFSIELVSLSTKKSSPMDLSFFTQLIYKKKVDCLTIELKHRLGF